MQLGLLLADGIHHSDPHSEVCHHGEDSEGPGSRVAKREGEWPKCSATCSSPVGLP